MLKEVLTVSALIAVVLLVRAIFKNRVPKRMLYALWLVVLLKLCLPGTLVSLPVLPAEKVAYKSSRCRKQRCLRFRMRRRCKRRQHPAFSPPYRRRQRHSRNRR